LVYWIDIFISQISESKNSKIFLKTHTLIKEITIFAPFFKKREDF